MRASRTPPGFRLSISLGCLSVCLLTAADRADAETNDNPNPGGVRLDAEVAESSGSFSDVIQAGAKLLGKGTRNETQPREMPEAEPKGSSTPTAKKSALAAIPLDQLAPEQRQRAAALLKASSFYRRLPKVTFSIEPEVYNYLLAHPDVAVSIWRAMKISKLQMWQTGRFEYEADAGDGSTGQLEVLYAGPEKILVVCNGIYKSPLFSKPIEARSLLLLQNSFFRETDGLVYVTHRADLFVEFPSQTVDVVSKIFSPLAVAMTDRTFSEISLFLKMMSLAMQRRPDWVEQIAGKMDGVADVRKTQVLELTSQVYTAAQKRSLERVADKEGSPFSVRSTTRPEGPSGIVPAAESAANPVERPSSPVPLRNP